MIDAKLLKQDAQGQWLYILEQLAPSISEALSNPGRKHITCPVHQGKNDFRVFKDVNEKGAGICSCGNWSDGISLLMWLHSWSFKETIGEVADVIGFSTELNKDRVRPVKREVVYIPKPPSITKEKKEKLTALYDSVWSSSLLIDDPKASPLRLYLMSRGLDISLIDKNGSIRFHSSLKYWDTENEKSLGNFPAMVSQVTDHSGLAVSLHYTYLTDKGMKADVPSVKKLMPSITGSVLGCSVRLGKFVKGETSFIGVTEGIETGLAVIEATNSTVWSTLSTSVLESFLPPDDVDSVLLWADKDKSFAGKKSSDKLKAKLDDLGYGSLILYPPIKIPEIKKGVDWLDVLNSSGKSAFPILNNS